MDDTAGERVGPMRYPPHLGELIRVSMDAEGLNVTETANRPGCGRSTLSRVLSGNAGGEHGTFAGGPWLGIRRTLGEDASSLRAGSATFGSLRQF